MDNDEWQELFEENTATLRQLEPHISDPKKERDIDISARFRDKETALNARSFVKSIVKLKEKPIVVIEEVSDDVAKFDVHISLFQIPNSKNITDAEWWMRQAVQKFHGEELGWMILPE